MPRTIPIPPELRQLIAYQFGVITTAQLADYGVGPGRVKHRVGAGDWQRLATGVVLTHSGLATREQLLLAAQLWAGDAAAIDAACACQRYGLIVPGFDPGQVHVVTSFGGPVRSEHWIRVRRTIGEIDVVRRGPLRYVLPPAAVLVAGRNARSKDDAISILSRGLQTGLVSMADLQAARASIGDKGCGRVDKALVAVGAGIRSVAENDCMQWVLSSRILPAPRFNQWLDLGDGGTEVCADVLIEDAGMFHEVNGKKYHGWAERFESSHVKVERMTAAGLLPTQATAIRWRRAGREALASLERIYQMNAGRGMPAGVRLIDPPHWATRAR